MLVEWPQPVVGTAPGQFGRLAGAEIELAQAARVIARLQATDLARFERLGDQGGDLGAGQGSAAAQPARQLVGPAPAQVVEEGLGARPQLGIIGHRPGLGEGGGCQGQHRQFEPGGIVGGQARERGADRRPVRVGRLVVVAGPKEGEQHLGVARGGAGAFHEPPLEHAQAVRHRRLRVFHPAAPADRPVTFQRH